jgi:hypothetical protein
MSLTTVKSYRVSVHLHEAARRLCTLRNTSMSRLIAGSLAREISAVTDTEDWDKAQRVLAEMIEQDAEAK